ncbi:MAG TPA: YihY/virulence factor BrkB family protein [Chitinophagales bacterium]|nr:YihY/virulence factor BrkB family protein [Chitinophagales bacterium]
MQLLNFFKPAIIVLQNTFNEFSKDHVTSLGAGLSFYTILSLPPILMVILLLLGNFLGPTELEDQINQNLTIIIGTDAAEIVHGIAKSAFTYQAGLSLTIIGILTTYFSATGVWVQLQWVLNYIWGVKPKAGTRNIVEKFLKDQLVALLIMVIIVVFMLIGLAYGMLLSYFKDFLELYLTDFSMYIMQLINLLVSYGMAVLLFAFAFKYIPDVQLKWKHVFAGAVCTALLFGIGRYLIGLYLSRLIMITGVYGVAGSVVLLLLWIYYTSIILFWGAEFTKALYLYRGNKVIPTRYATLTPHEF